MIFIVNEKTHVGLTPPESTARTWISEDLAEISFYPEPDVYQTIENTLNIKESLLTLGIDLFARRFKIYEITAQPDVKRYINGEWIVVDPSLYFDIAIDRQVMAFTEADAIAEGEIVEDFDGTVTITSND